MARREVRTLKPTTAALYGDYIAKDLIPALGAVRLEKLNHLHVARFVDDPLTDLFEVLIGTGLRKGEALALHWAGVHLDQ